jgi:hypothetical protein
MEVRKRMLWSEECVRGWSGGICTQAVSGFGIWRRMSGSARMAGRLRSCFVSASCEQIHYFGV